MLMVSVGLVKAETAAVRMVVPKGETATITVTVIPNEAYPKLSIDNGETHTFQTSGSYTVAANANNEQVVLVEKSFSDLKIEGQVSSLQINDPKLKTVEAKEVGLSSLTIADNALISLVLPNNKLESIDVKNATKLETLNVSGNQLNSIASPLPTSLKVLNIANNGYKGSGEITGTGYAWDLTSLNQLKELYIGGNTLKEVKVGDNVETFDKGIQDFTSIKASETFKANDRFSVQKLGNAYFGINSAKFVSAEWKTKDGGTATEAHSIGMDADNSVTYCFYKTVGQDNIFIDEETVYECTLKTDDDYAYKVLVTVQPAEFELKLGTLPHDVEWVVKRGQENLNANNNGLKVKQGDELSIGVKFEKPEAKNYAFGEWTKHDGLALISGESWSENPVRCTVQGKYMSPSTDETPSVDAKIVGKDVKVTFNTPELEQGTLRVVQLNADGTVEVISNSPATLPFGTKLRIELTPNSKSDYIPYLFVNGGEAKDLTNDSEGKYVWEGVVTEDWEITATFRAIKNVALNVLVNGEALNAQDIGKITLQQGDLEKTIDGTTKTVQLRADEVCTMSFNVGKAVGAVTEVKIGNNAPIQPTKTVPNDESVTYYYTFTPTADATISIKLNKNQIDPQLTVEDQQTVTYDGTVKSIQYTVEPNLSGIKVLYKSPGDAAPIEDPINAGTYTVTITREADGQYKAINKTCTLTIKKAKPIITSVPVVAISSDKASYMLTGGKANTEGTFEVTAPATPNTTTAHEVTIEFTADDLDNYEGGTTVKVEVIPEGCTPMARRVVDIEKTYPAGIKNVTLLNNGTTEADFGDKFTDGTTLIVLVSYEEGIDPSTITLHSELIKTGDGSHGENTTYSDASACIKAFTYMVNMDEGGTQGDLLSVKVGDELKYDYVIKLKKQENDYTGNVIEYLKGNVTISKDPDDPNSFTEPSFTITYKEVSDGAPINAGDYTVCISIKAGKGYKAVNAKEFTGYFTINTVYPQVIWPTARPISLGQSLDYAWLEGGSSPSTTGKFEWAENPTPPKNGEAYAVKFIPDNTNYREVTTDLADKVKVTIIDQRLVTYRTNYGSPQTDIIVKDNTGKVYPSGSPVEKGAVLTVEATTTNDKLELVAWHFSGPVSWSGNTFTVGDSSVEIEAIFDVKEPEVPDPEPSDPVIDEDSQYIVTVKKASTNNRGFILGKEGENGVYYEKAFEFTVNALDADLDKLVVTNATKVGKGKYRIESVTGNTTVTVSLPNPTPIDVKVVTESKNAKGYLMGKVKAESYPLDGKCYYGDELVVVAYPESGVSFSYWKDNALNKDQMREIVVTKAMTIEAVFSGVPTGIEDIESASIYAGDGYIQVKNVANADLTIVSISGRIQARQSIEGDTQIRVPAGVYVVVLESGEDVKRVKVIVR